MLGVDLAEPAVRKARSDWAGISNLEFMVTDATDPGAGQAIRDAVGSDANVFVRGVFHILDSAERPRRRPDAATVLGSRGRLFLSETNFLGSQLGYMTNLGASTRTSRSRCCERSSTCRDPVTSAPTSAP